MDLKLSSCLKSFPTRWCLWALYLKLYSPIFSLTAPSRQNGRARLHTAVVWKQQGRHCTDPRREEGCAILSSSDHFFFLLRKGVITRPTYASTHLGREIHSHTHRLNMKSW